MMIRREREGRRKEGEKEKKCARVERGQKGGGEKMN